LIPDEWLEGERHFESIEQHRNAYAQFLESRVLHSALLVNEANHARESLI
jgi:hypothetical protein